MNGWENIKYFKSHEFDSPDKKGSGESMQYDFVLKLDKARSLAKIPFKVTSGYRTPSHNKKIGGVANSSHIKGFAADIHVNTDRDRLLVVKAAIESGIFRIGISDNFIHLDTDPNKNPAIWLYPVKKSIISILQGNFKEPQDI